MIGLAKLGPGRNNVGIIELPDPYPEPGFAAVRVTAAGICGTDLHIIADEYASRPPVIMGHEVAGVVDGVGAEADEHWIGRRVVAETYFRTCGTCDLCRAGRRNLCSERESIGSAQNGGFATALLVPVANLHEIPEAVSDRAGALVEPLACVVQSILVSDVPLVGRRVLVTGPGPMGMLAAQVARAGGAEVLVSGLPRDDTRLRALEALGIATTVDMPAPRSFDVALECSGAAQAASTAISALTPGGRYVAIGIFGRDVTLPFDELLYKELTFTSGFASTPGSWNLALALVRSGAVDLECVVSDVLPLDEWQEALDRVRSGTGLKVILTPGSMAHEQRRGSLA